VGACPQSGPGVRGDAGAIEKEGRCEKDGSNSSDWGRKDESRSKSVGPLGVKCPGTKKKEGHGEGGRGWWWPKTKVKSHREGGKKQGPKGGLVNKRRTRGVNTMGEWLEVKKKTS